MLSTNNMHHSHKNYNMFCFSNIIVIGLQASSARHSNSKSSNRQSTIRPYALLPIYPYHGNLPTLNLTIHYITLIKSYRQNLTRTVDAKLDSTYTPIRTNKALANHIHILLNKENASRVRPGGRKRTAQSNETTLPK